MKKFALWNYFNISDVYFKNNPFIRSDFIKYDLLGDKLSKNNISTFTCFFDLQKSFDRVKFKDVGNRSSTYHSQKA